MTRPVLLSDAPAIRDIYAPFVEDTPVTFDEAIPTVAEMRDRIAAVIDKLPWLVWEEDGEIQGYAYATPHRTRKAYRWSVETSVYVSPKFHRKGIAKALYKELFRILSQLNYYHTYAGISYPNDASIRLHEGFGFSKVAHHPFAGYKLGRWHDVGWWQKLLNEPAGEPGEPLPWNPKHE